MENLPLASEKEVKLLGGVATNGFSWPCDAVGQATKGTGLWLDLRLLDLTTLHQCVPVYVYGPTHYYTYIYIYNYIIIMTSFKTSSV